MALEQLYDNNTVLSLLTLGSLDAVAINSKIDGARKNGFRVVKSNIWVAMNGKTTDEGPIIMGVACNTISSQVELILENDPQSPSSSDERGTNNFVKALLMVGKDELKIPIATSGDNRSWMPFVVSYGKNGWSIPEDQALSYWAYNLDDAALTTGTQFEIFAEHFGVWLKD